MLRNARRWGPGALAAGLLAFAPSAAARAPVVSAGAARFQVLTPTLIRAEFSQDRRFENRPTMTATRARLPVPAFAITRSHGWLTITTQRLKLRYRVGSRQFSPGNLKLTFAVAGRRTTVGPRPGDSQGNLGGWRRALDLLDGPVQLNDGLLSRAGWNVLDHTATALLTPGAPRLTVRPAHPRPYQRWHLVALG